MRRTKDFVTVIFLIFSLLFSLIGFVSPWWTIRTSRRQQIASGKLATVNYMPFQTVVANEAGSNYSVTITFADWPENGTGKGNLAFVFNVTLGLSAVGAILTGSALALILMSIFRRPFYRLARFLATIGTILLFIAPLYLSTSVPGALTSFNNVVPSQLSYLPGSTISSFWGTSEPWMWGAGVGWHLIFIASLLALIATILIHGKMREVSVRPIR